MFKRFTILLAGLLSSCAGNPPTQLGLKGDQLTPCPSTPNCISSNTRGTAHFIEPITLIAPAANAWKATIDTLAKLPRCTIKTHTDTYCHAECRSRVFGFVDDIELHLNADKLQIAIRSAARIGHSDFGVNRSRIAALNAELVKNGITQPGQHHD